MSKKIKILQIIGDASFTGGPQHVLTLSSGLDRNQFDVTIAFPSGPAILKFKKNNLNTVIISMKSKADLSAIFKLRKLIKKENFDIIHTHGSRGGSIGRLASWGLKKYVVYTEHTRTSDFKLKNPLLDKIHIIGLRFLDYLTDKTIAPSDAVKRWLVNSFVTEPNKVETILNGIDLSKFNINIDEEEKRKQLDVNNKKFLICTIASLSPHKGIKDLIIAFDKIRKKIPNIDLLIVGSGPQKKELEEKARKLKILKNIKFLGTRDDIPEILKIVDLFVLPSYSEPFGLVILEAMASRKPVVGTSVGGIKDIIKDGETGFIVPPGNSQKLADAIIKTIKDPQKAKIMGESGRKRLEKYFTSEIMVIKTANLYKELFKG